MAQYDPNHEALLKAQDVQQRYQNYLMKKPHVVGVGVGFACVKGTETPEVAVVVMVDHKLPPESIAPMDRLPSRLEGVRIDVQETGVFGAFSATAASV